MEDTNRVIDIAVGVIIFIIALSVNIFLYASINKSIKEVLSINDTDASIIVTQEDISRECVKYSSSEIFFMIQNIIASFDDGTDAYVKDAYSPYNEPNRANNTTYAGIKVSVIGKNNSSKTWLNLKSLINDMQRVNPTTGVVTYNFDQYFAKDATYKVEYVYVYEELDKLNLSNHRIAEIKFTEM